MVINNKREMRFAQVCLALTLICYAGLLHYLGLRVVDAYTAGNVRLLAEIGLFGLAFGFMAHGTLLYHICLIGNYKRRESFKPASREALDRMYEGKAPSLSVLIPSYKEERMVNWQTMMSAALSEYPHKHVVLLIDDPCHPKALEDIRKLDDTRKIPGELQALFDTELKRVKSARAAFRKRAKLPVWSQEAELETLAAHYESVARWLDGLAATVADGQPLDVLNHNDRFFIEGILQAPAQKHRKLARKLHYMATLGHEPGEAFFNRHYARLIGLFTVSFASFERKKYANLSHEANKAMNINSYTGLIGRSFKEVETPEGLMLVECPKAEATIQFPAADYVNTIDADSLMTHDYAIRLIHHMEQPENHGVAVAQSPCSSIPGSPVPIERAAAACIDVQFRTHQGYTHWCASYWVGANAMLRMRALEEIKEIRMENGHPISIYIQDRTVIEDTESSIDLVHKGWKLYNYPERMTFSATPPDFGSLLIQRRRWSNGGFLILPKLLHYAWHAPKNLALLKELFLRVQYLAGTTTGCMAALILMFFPFENTFRPIWAALAVVPYLVLFARDLRNTGYKVSELWRICALNIMLLPIMVGGVLKQFQQMITGKKIPFSRTPKIPGRTAAPAFYCLIELALPVFMAFSGMIALQEGRTFQGVFSFVNVGFMLYAIVVFMGVRPTFEDLFAGVRTRWRAAFHKAEVIPMPGMQEIPVAVTVQQRQSA